MRFRFRPSHHHESITQYGRTRKVLIPPVSERDHAQGLATAATTLVEYGDYQDPQCAAAQPLVKALQARMGDRLRLVFRHFLATGLSPHAAEAAEAAGLQDRFWAMHDTLFAHQSALGTGHIVEYANDLKLDMSRFLRDMTGHVSSERLDADRESGAQSGVREAPAFFVNGVRQPGSWKEASAWADLEQACADDLRAGR
jgi:protein-disulfide isomerase